MYIDISLPLFQLFSGSVEGFLSVRQSGVSVLSILRGRVALQRLCRVHPVLGPLYGLLLMGGGVWLFARLCGTVLICTYRYTLYKILLLVWRFGYVGKNPSTAMCSGNFPCEVERCLVSEVLQTSAYESDLFYNTQSGEKSKVFSPEL